MLPEKMEQGFNQNLEAIQLLQNALGTSFLEAYVENAENLIDDYQVRGGWSADKRDNATDHSSL